MPWVDVDADVTAIREGRAIRDGNSFTVNGRTYGIEPNGRLFPRTGDGFHQLNRGAYRALSLYNDPDRSAVAEHMLDLESVPEVDRAIARHVLDEINDWRRRP